MHTKTQFEWSNRNQVGGPMNSLNVALYTPGNFKNCGDGTFKALKK